MSSNFHWSHGIGQHCGLFRGGEALEVGWRMMWKNMEIWNMRKRYHWMQNKRRIGLDVWYFNVHLYVFFLLIWILILNWTHYFFHVMCDASWCIPFKSTFIFYYFDLLIWTGEFPCQLPISAFNLDRWDYVCIWKTQRTDHLIKSHHIILYTVPSWELTVTYPIQKQLGRWVSFPIGGICDRSLEGNFHMFQGPKAMVLQIHTRTRKKGDAKWMGVGMPLRNPWKV